MSTEHSRPSQGGSKGNWLVAGVILVLAISGGIYIQFFGPGRSHQNANPKVVLRSAEECRRMMELNNKALGLLENYEVTAAIESLRAVAEGLPEEPTVVRNLALAHVMAVEKKLEADHLDGLLEKLRRLEPESPIADYFAARAALARKEHAAEAGDFDTVKELEMTGVKFLEAAAQRSPKDASLWFEIAEIAANSPDEELRGKRVEALRQAYALAPDNLAATTRWLIAQAEIQDESIAETLKGARSSFAPLVASVKQRSAISDPEKLLDAAEQALEKGQWNQIRPPVRQLDNVIKPEEWWQSDYRRIKGRHVLEFVAHQFTKTHCSQEPETVDAIDIKLERRPASGALGEVSSAGVVELRVMDFDLDGMFDVAVLEGDKLSVFGRGDLTRDWELLASVSLTGSVRGLLVADLDRESVGADGKPAPASERNKPATDEPDQCQNADVDLVVYGPEGVSVFRNELDKETGKRQLLPVEQTPDFQNLREILAGALVDIDADGDLDLVFSSSAGYTVWMNRGDAQFIDASARSALPPQGLLATTLVPFDWNQDLDLDVIAVGPGGEPAGYLENLRHGQFRWRPFEGSAKELAGARQVCLGDALQPGRWDLYAAGESGVKRVRHAIRFPLDDAGDAGEPALPISSSAQERLLMVDIDNDSLSDLVSWNEETLSLFRATEVGLVHDQTGLLDKRPTGVRGCAVGDLDNDGDVDLVVADADGVALYANAGGNRRHWIDVRVRGEVDQRGGGRVNHLGVGSLI
ncbi:MAG: FG-GAP-like repeat-containing protein, partial [Planctomycetales bacterium]